MTKSVIAGSTLALLIVMADAGAQQPVPAPPTGAPPAAGTAPHAYRAKQIIGSKVAVQGNASVGTVDDIVFNDAGDVEYLLVVNDGRYVTVPWSAARYNYEQRVAVVNITPEQYRVIPTWTAPQYPNFYAPDYRTQVYKYYGLTPGQLRRIERREGLRP